jgi:hypothetical protein
MSWVYDCRLDGISGSNLTGPLISLLWVLWCCVEVFSSGRSLVQRSPTEYLCVFRCNNNTIHLQWVGRKCDRKEERSAYEIHSKHRADDVTIVLIAMKFGPLIELFISGLQIDTPTPRYDITSFTFIIEVRSRVGPDRSDVVCTDTPCRPTHCCYDAVCTAGILTALCSGKYHPRTSRGGPKRE